MLTIFSSCNRSEPFRCWIITKAREWRTWRSSPRPGTRAAANARDLVSIGQLRRFDGVPHVQERLLTLAPRSDSPRSTRSAPYPAGVAASGGGGSVLNRSSRGESPRSVRSAAPAPDSHSYRVSRRTSSVDSQSSVDSRGHRRHRRSRGRSSDGESEASSKCSSRGHRRHRHRHHSDDSDHHRHRHRRRRHKSGGGMVNDAQWVQAQASQGQVRGNTATVRDLTHKSGYQPSGHDTEADSHHHQHSNKKRHRKHRSRSRSPSEAKTAGTQGLTEAELKEIPYTKVETAKTIKIKYTSPKTKRHKSPRRSKSNSSDRKATPPADGESPPPPYTPSPTTKTNTLPKVTKENGGDGGPGVRNPEGGMVNGTLRPLDQGTSSSCKISTSNLLEIRLPSSLAHSPLLETCQLIPLSLTVSALHASDSYDWASFMPLKQGIYSVRCVHLIKNRQGCGLSLLLFPQKRQF
nr:band 4.1-like protein 4A [Penaeus vannamei]